MFFERLRRGLRHSLILVSALPNASKRALLARMLAFSRALPAQFDQPLPQMMAHLTPPATSNPQNLTPDDIRRLADALAAWHFRSPLGICLRRSLLRYHFLRQAGLPVSIVFGARLKGANEGGGIGGHAWLTLDDLPYYENAQDYSGFVEMYVYPVDGKQ
ncbi:MAG: lasso peptide biosynthesis B2 protein [Anaerolineae bacterium]|nr:lasso peptide biosynthesis B2 protein [Anaerolineales bacterium]MCQ3975968.1 lasso peptide biosynthesis B2 protein [Anaerolineae bacterium]